MKPRWGAYPRSTGKPSQNSAAKDTNHLGQGRCRHHSGATPTEKCSPSLSVRRTRNNGRVITRRRFAKRMNSSACCLIFAVKARLLHGKPEKGFHKPHHGEIEGRF